MAETISTRPWSDFKESDYDDEQWIRACILDRGVDAGTPKQRYSLPVREPSGVLNKNGVHAAAGALAGARGGIKAIPEQKAAARKKLARLYSVLDEEVPESLSHSVIEDVLAHHGVKGQKWGVRKKASGPSGSGRGFFELTGKAAPKPGQTFTHKGSNYTVLAKAKTGDGEFQVGAKKSSMVTPEQRAALKVQGKNFAQRAMGDKEYWKKAAAVGVVAGVGLAAAAAAPAVLPASALAAGGGALHVQSVLSGSTLAASRIGSLGNALHYRRRVRGALRTAVHSELSHVDDPTVEEVYNAMSEDKKVAAQTLIAAAVEGVDVSGEEDLNATWGTMSQEEQAVVYFIASVADVQREVEMAHSDLYESFVFEYFEDDSVLEHHGIKGQKWGVRRKTDSATGRVEQAGRTGLEPRIGSQDQINQDRIAKKIASGGAKSLSNADIQAYTRRLQMQKDLDRVLAEQSAAEKAASQNFITKFVKKQAGRQTNRVVDKALDVAVEKALESAGLKLGKKGANPDLADLLVKTSGRLQPKKK